ncbi:MAG: choice-of-anchor tandem repeat GloVer-containing protein [Alphaproteobacteria bacterium]
MGGAKCDCGTVFKITPHGRKRTLYSFGGETDGYNPIDGLVLGADGALYGTTERVEMRAVSAGQCSNSQPMEPRRPCILSSAEMTGICRPDSS